MTMGATQMPAGAGACADDTQAPSSRRILIVDDNRAIHDDFRKILGDPPEAAMALAALEAALFGPEVEPPCLPPFLIDSAHQGEEALGMVDKARREDAPYAVAFIDVRMPPGWDGVETARRIWEVDAELQVVICTAYSDYSWAETVAKLGLHSERFLILKKPFDALEVRQLAAALAKKWELSQKARAKMEGLEEAVRTRTAAIREAHERLQRELAQRHQIEAQLRRAQKLEALGRLAAGIAHEINNPLAFVIANMQYVREALTLPPEALAKAPFDELRAALSEAVVGGERIKQIVRDLKAFAQPHDESVTVVDVRPVIDFSLKMTASEVRRRAQLETRFDEVPPVWAIAGRLEQVFVNLLINAAHAVPSGKARENTIRVTVRAHGDNVAIEIADTGVGIPASDLERIFDPFFTTKPVGVGTGLGLSICHSIVSAFGGELTVESEEGKGSTFRVSLPAARYAADAPEAQPTEERMPAVARILLVDPEPSIVKAMRRVLSAHKIEATDSGLEALALCQRRRFDLVLYDVMTGDCPAPDVYRRLHELGDGAERRMVFTSAGALPAEVAAFVVETGVPCLDKPFDASDIDRLLRDRKRGGEA
jgi:two-component system NtrC family sensor kinase